MHARAKAMPQRDVWERVTDLALVLAVGLVLARGMMLESLREAQSVPGQEIVLRSPGAAVTVVCDFLAFVPALLVGVRGLLDERFRLRWPMSLGFLSLLGLWALASVGWSADRFAAAVSAGRLLGAAAIGWAVLQCVRDWKTFRIITAAVCGLLAVLLVHSLVYYYYELPDTRKVFEENRAQLLAQQGIEGGTFRAQQFVQKLMAGELMGFYGSANSLAAVTAMISVIVVASLWQRRRDGGQAAWYLPGIALLIGAGWIVWRTQSNTAVLTPILGVAMLVMGWRLRSWMAQHRRGAFAAGVGVFLLGWAAVIGHGLYHGNLVQRSLTFRWQYWVASMAMLRDHLLLGVGWSNFGNYYLQYRLPTAPEEIQDPHNLFVRFATELGIFGVLLAVGWLARLAWEVTRPMAALPAQAPEWEITQEPLKAIAPLVRIALIATIVLVIAAVDFTQDPLNVLMEVMRRVLYGLLIVVTSAVLAAADLQKPRLERRPAEILLVGVVCGLAVFILHNFIDFSLFEIGPLYLFVMLGAAAVGVRLRDSDAGEGRGGLVIVALVVLLGLGFGVGVVAPTVQGESASRRGDLNFADSKAAQAQQDYADAFIGSAWLRNADYLIRRSGAQFENRERPADLLATFEQAIAANPRLIPAHLGRAAMLRTLGQAEKAIEECEAALRLNPNDVGMRLRAAEIMAQIGRSELAARQYQAALDNNERLPLDEPKRLPEKQVEEIKQKMAGLAKRP